MEQIINFIKENGGIAVLAVLFIYCFFADMQKNKKFEAKREEELQEEKRNNNTILKELSNSNKNIAESLNLLRMSIDTNTNEFKQHDERAIKEFANISEKLTIINEKVSK